MAVHVKRVYEPAESGDGFRVLIDGIWPRGIRKADARIEAWMRDLAPSTGLRKWFGHDPERWREFRRRYHDELDTMPERVHALARRGHTGTVTLCFGARDRAHNNAVALRDYLAGIDTD